MNEVVLMQPRGRIRMISSCAIYGQVPLQYIYHLPNRVLHVYLPTVYRDHQSKCEERLPGWQFRTAFFISDMQNPKMKMIHVHDTTTLEFKRHFTISGLKSVHDMAATEDALYISDTSFVHKVSLPRETTTNKWTVDGTILEIIRN